MNTLTLQSLRQVCLTAAFALLAAFAAGQNATQLIKISVTFNENMPSQPTATFILMFDSIGNDSIAYPDAGNEGTLGQFNDEVYPFSVTQDGFVLTNLDGRPTLNTYKAIPFGFVTKNAGDIKVVAKAISMDPNTPPADFVWLEQISTGERFSILDTAKFTLAANPNYQSDFILHVGPDASSVPTHETCAGNNDGAITVTGPNYNNFTLELYQGASQILNTVVAGTDTTVNLNAGSYVSVIRINGIAVDSSDVIINAAAPLIADFLTDNNYVEAGETVTFTDNSTGGAQYTWDFGDGDTSCTSGTQAHAFSQDGSYQVVLTVCDSNGCTASAFDFVEVNSNAPSLANNTFQPRAAQMVIEGNYARTTITSSSDHIIVDLGSVSATQVSVMAMNGTMISNSTQNESRAEYVVPAAGAYIVTIAYADGSVVSRTIVTE